MKVLQYGCFGTQNYGDEVSAWAVRSVIRAAHPKAQFALIGNVEASIKALHGDLAGYATAGDYPLVQELLRWADVCVYGPGTVMGTKAWPLVPWLLEAGTPVVVWGVGAMPTLPNSHGGQLCKRATLVTVRDPVSLEHVREACPGALQVPDPILWRSMATKEAVTPTWRVGVTISWDLTRYPKQVQDRVLHAMAEALLELGGPVVGIPASWDHCGVQAYDDDTDVLEQLAQLVPGMEVVRPEGFVELEKVLAGLRGYFTSRLHTGVYAAGMGVPVVFFGHAKMGWSSQALGTTYLGEYPQLTAQALLEVRRAQTDKIRESMLEAGAAKRLLVEGVEAAAERRSAQASPYDPTAWERQGGFRNGLSPDQWHDYRRNVVSWIAELKPESLLDVGFCASDWIRAHRAAGYEGTYTGVDVTPSCVEVARSEEPGEEFMVGDARKLEGVPDRGYECVVCSNVLMHLPELGPPMQELFRVARRYVVISLYGSDTTTQRHVYPGPFLVNRYTMEAVLAEVPEGWQAIRLARYTNQEGLPIQQYLFERQEVAR